MKWTWTALVRLVDLDLPGSNLGDTWTVQAVAATKTEARREIRRKAWDDVDSRVNDASIEFVTGPVKVKVSK